MICVVAFGVFTLKQVSTTSCVLGMLGLCWDTKHINKNLVVAQSARREIWQGGTTMSEHSIAVPGQEDVALGSLSG